MLRYVKHHQTDYQRWDACIEAAPEQIIYALSWYLNVVSPGWAAFIYEENGVYLAVMPLPETRKAGFNFLYQPFFCQQLGFFSQEPNVNIKSFWQQLPKQYTYIRKYAFNTHNTAWLLPNMGGLAWQIHQTHHLDLNVNYEALFSGYSRDRKLNLKRAQKAGFGLIESQDIEPLINLFKEDAANRITGGVSQNTYQLLRALFTETNQRGLARLIYAQTPHGEISAGCLFTVYGGKIIYLFNAASKAGRNLNGRTLILDYIIRQYAAQPFILDFESPMLQPITRVYQGFGSKPAGFYVLNLNNLPAPVKFLKKARQLVYQRVMATFKKPSKTQAPDA